MPGPAPDAVGLVAAEVREHLLRTGTDPLQDPGRTRRVVEATVAGYRQRAMGGVLPPMADPADAARRVLDEVAGFGPLQRYLDDPAVEEIWINAPDAVFVAPSGGVPRRLDLRMTREQVRTVVERMLAPSGRRLDLSTPFVDAALPDGSRLHVAIPDVTRSHWAVNIRKFVVRASNLRELVPLGTLTADEAWYLDDAVRAGRNVLVSGGTQTGKTTLLNCLVGAVPVHERVITCEEVFELRPALPDVVALQCRQPGLEGTGEIPLRRLVKESLRMRPDRLVVGEVRQAECLDLLIALNSGLPGMCTLHANSAREAVTKMCTLPLLAGPNVSAAFVVPTVAACIDIVVHLDRQGTVRRVAEILEVTGEVGPEGAVTVPVRSPQVGTGS